MKGTSFEFKCIHLIWIFFPSLCLPKEIEKLRLELSESKQHAEQEQQKAARARQECLQVTELLGEAERQLYLTRYALITLHTQHPAWPTGLCHRLPAVVTLSHSIHTQLSGILRKVETWQAKQADSWMMSVAGITGILQKHLSTVLKCFSGSLPIEANDISTTTTTNSMSNKKCWNNQVLSVAKETKGRDMLRADWDGLDIKIRNVFPKEL